MKILLAFVLICVFGLMIFGQRSEEILSPVRPTVSDSANVQRPDVLQIDSAE